MKRLARFDDKDLVDDFLYDLGDYSYREGNQRKVAFYLHGNLWEVQWEIGGNAITFRPASPSITKKEADGLIRWYNLLTEETESADLRLVKETTENNLTITFKYYWED